MLASDFAQHPATVGVAELDQQGERVEGRRNIARLLGDDDQAIVLMVIGERNTEAVEDAPARRCQKPQTDPVLVCEHGVAVGLQDLQLIHAGCEGGDEHRLAAGKDRCTPAEELLTPRFLLHR